MFHPSKHETHKQVPTWNYSVVHDYGRVTIRDDARAVRAIVARLIGKSKLSQNKEERDRLGAPGSSGVSASICYKACSPP